MKRIKLIGGIQWNKPQEIDGHLSPRIGVIGYISDKVQLKLLHSEAFRQPSALEKYINHPKTIGNPELKPETIITDEAQMSYQTTKSTASLTYYQSKMEDLITRTWVDTVGEKRTFMNSETHDFWGVEFEGRWNVLPKLSLISSFTYQENENDSGQKNSSFGPNTMAKIGALYYGKAVTIGLFNSYFGDRTDVNDLLPPEKQIEKTNPEPLAYNLFSANISVDVYELLNIIQNHSITLTLYLDNIFDEDIWVPEMGRKEINSLPLYPGRAVYSILSVNF